IEISSNLIHHSLYGKTHDTIIYFRVLPNEIATIRYYVWDHDIMCRSYLYEDIEIEMQDTTVHSKFIETTADFYCPR
ncbi:MAG: hypothetical protein M3512_09580, partial [Bacteroidota bacterium]|nr:hypothetical protein [Bacteroidota bacterium]